MNTNAQPIPWPAPLPTPSALSSFGTLFRLCLDQMIFRRKTFLLLAVAGIPVILAIATTIARSQLPLQNISNTGIYQILYTLFYMHVLLLLIPGLYGISLIGDEVEAKTLTCLTTRPVSKGVILVAKLTAYGLVTAAILGISLAASYFILHLGVDPATMLGGLDGFLRDFLVLCVGLMVYGAVFTLFGIALKRSLIAALLYAIWESVFAYIPGIFHKMTVLHYLQTHSRISSEYAWLLTMVKETTEKSTATLTLILIFLVTIAVASLIFYSREYKSQEPGV